MSFILDALKKSESDRQRQSGPALFEVKVAPPKSRFPVWAIAIGALLVVNMIIVGWMLLRRSSHGEDATAANTPPAATSATTAGAGAATPPAISPSASATPAPTAPPLNSMQPNSTPPGVSAGSASPGSPQPANPQYGSTSPAQNQQGTGSVQARMPQRDQNEPTLAGNATQTGNAGGAGGTNTDPAANPDDYTPAAEPGSPLFKGHVKRGTESGLQLYQDAALVPGNTLPQLRLDLHVYAANPQERFALINMHKMHEGDSLQDGVRVESITPDGVVMSHNGSKFLLPRE
jgi:general secretion pathway protein B